MEFLILDVENIANFFQFIFIIIILIVSAFIRYLAKDQNKRQTSRTQPRPPVTTMPRNPVLPAITSPNTRLANIKNDQSDKMSDTVAKKNVKENFSKITYKTTYPDLENNMPTHIEREAAIQKEFARLERESKNESYYVMSDKSADDYVEPAVYESPEPAEASRAFENRASIQDEDESGVVYSAWDTINTLPYLQRTIVLMELFKKPVGLRDLKDQNDNFF
jgi:hypothetical protein